jgi:hypothetical protein
MVRTKHILIRTKNIELEPKELAETMSRMRSQGLKLYRSKIVYRYGKNYTKLVFKTPEDEKT